MALRQAIAKSQGSIAAAFDRRCRIALQSLVANGIPIWRKARNSAVFQVWHAPCIDSGGPKWSSKAGATHPGLREAPPRKNKRPALVLRGVFLFSLKRRRSGCPACGCSASLPALLGFPPGARPLRGHPFGRALALATLRAEATFQWSADTGRAPTASANARPRLCEESQGGRTSAARRLRAKTNQPLTAPLSSKSCCSSPASNISIMMSLPPTNSPFT